MTNKLTGRNILEYYHAAVIKEIITMDEFYEIATILPTRNLNTRINQMTNIPY